MPKNFHIFPVPQQMVSWVCKTLILSTKPHADPKESIPSATGAVLTGNTFCPLSIFETISSWIASQKGCDQESLSIFLKNSETASFPEETIRIYKASTIREAMDQVEKVFDANERPQTFKPSTEKLDFEMNVLMEGFKNGDHPEKYEVAITPYFIRQNCNHSNKNKERHVPMLLIIACFML